MNTYDFKDFYIRYKGHPKYVKDTIIEDDVINVIIQKYETIIFTNKGEVLGDPNFGADLLLLLYETKTSSDYVEKIIQEQIAIYIPELQTMNYQLKAVFSQDPENFQDILFIYFQISDYEVYAQIGNVYGSI